MDSAVQDAICRILLKLMTVDLFEEIQIETLG